MPSQSAVPTLTFLIQCPDRRGLVSKLSTFFYQRGFNVLDCQQHTESLIERFFMRMVLDLRDLASSRAVLKEELGELAESLAGEWTVHFSDQRQRTAILVTRASHCLYDLLVRQREGELDCDIPVIISNHPRLEAVADQFRVPFHCLPVTAETKAEQERQLGELLKRYHIDLVVLARYMRVLSDDVVSAWSGRMINIHHAFLPAFRGARAYKQAWARGVKMIGATGHYVTAELDEGPIIEQDVERVTHAQSPRQLARIGRDVERVVLARAVKAHLEHRVIVYGRRTVVFPP